MSGVEPRALTPADAAQARHLVSARFAGTQYLARMMELLESALRFDDPEHAALVTDSASRSAPEAMILFGTVAGAAGVVKMHALVGDDRDPLARLVEELRLRAERSGDRMLLCELPDDGSFRLASEVLEQHGFVEEGRVEDYVRDGVAIRLLVWRR